jgi:small subunit ribosomal protein S16
MALKIRLRQQGRTNRAFYRLVVADSRYPRDGKYLEALGWYNPIETEADKQTFVKPDRLKHWLSVGAQLSDNVVALLKRIEPGIVRAQVQKEVAHRAKAAVKRKEKKQVKA